MEILFEDKHFIAINKKGGIPAQPDLTGDKSCQSNLEELKKHPLFILNRLDRPVSGCLIFAKNKDAARLYTNSLKEGKISKKYIAAVEKKPPQKNDTISNYLIQKNNKAYINNHPKAKKATLTYRHFNSSDNYHFLEIDLLTGRFHQIRVQLSHLGCPIKGDVKYGARRSNKDRSIHLHASEYSFYNNEKNEIIKITAPLPTDPVWNVLKHS